jgi:hypothetical protein
MTWEGRRDSLKSLSDLLRNLATGLLIVGIFAPMFTVGGGNPVTVRSFWIALFCLLLVVFSQILIDQAHEE